MLDLLRDDDQKRVGGNREQIVEHPLDTLAENGNISSAEESAAVNQRQLVPGYFYPAWSSSLNYWVQVLAMKKGSIAIMNPGSGPGTSGNPDYARAISECHARHHKVIGYVSTRYGERPLAAVKTDVASYRSWYPALDGIFFDEMPNDPAMAAAGGLTALAYYKQLYAAVRNTDDDRRGIVAGNPGNAAATAWQVDAPVADVLVIFEGSAATYETWRQPPWVAKHPAHRFGHLVYGCDAAATAHVVSLARSRNAGWVYVTDQSESDGVLWTRLPVPWPNPI
ncbi:spherulation-specific family 4 protein [Arthrobacter globiformis]|uniref:PEP-CTERM sorting domain-containing protein n=1 Tax=Arthrobacter globiformis TaxID=1665 RepID=A0A328HGM7_ARTGO|nr:spherulation-specific family 4 protein [Arthrobacter globiformis]RAM37768.1 PEP-CTERM sorting domain-containing protein [Arthrobacter globiformis]